MTTKRDVDKSPFLIVKNQQNNDVKLVVSPSSFQVGLTNSPSSLTATGHATFQQGITSNNPAYFYQGLSGSLTKLTDGTSYLVAGNNVTITSASNGQVTISSTAGGGGSGDVVGPASATDNAIVRFDLTTGKLIQDSAVTIADTTGNITTPGDIAINGGDITTTAATFNITNTNATTINIGGAATAVNVGASSALAIIGEAELGELPFTKVSFPGAYAFFSHKTLDNTVNGNYALVQSYDGYTYLNSPTTITFQYAGSSISGGTIGTLDNNTVSFTGLTGTATTTTLGNTAGASSTTIDAGTGNINIGTSDSSRTTNIATAATTNQIVNIGNTQGLSYSNIYGGSLGVYMSASFITMSSSYPRQNLGADAIIGAAEIGSLPGFSNQYAMFGHQALDHTLGNYAIVQENDGDTYLNAPESKYVYFTSAGNPSYNGYIGYSGAILGTLINLQGRSGQRVSVTIGNAVSTSATSIYAGSGGITLSGSNQTTVITGSSSTIADAHIGDAEIGSLPGFAGQYAMFGHKDLNHSFGNYAIAQQNDGTTYLNSPENDYVYFTSAGNPAHNGYIGYNTLFGTLINFQGRSGQRAAVTLGNTNSTSATSIYAGSGGITLSGSNQTTVITGSSSATADAYIGDAEIGSLPGFSGQYAMFGHKDLNHSLGNYALVQENDGDTYLNAPEAKYVYFTSAGNPAQNGYIGYTGAILGTLINLQGRSGQRASVTIGNSTSTSLTSIYAGSGGITLSGSNQTTVITGSSSTSADAHIGDAEIGSLPGFAGQYAMFGHKDLNHAFGNYAVAQQNDGTTYLNAPENDYVYFTSAGNVAHNGYIGYNTLFGTLINFQGRSGQRAAVTIGNATSTSATSIYAGSGGITLSGSGGQTVITGSTTSYTDATIGAWEIGSLPATQGTFPNVYAFVGHKDLNHSSDGNYALVQSNVGDTFIGAVSAKDVYFKNGTTFIGQISNDTISLTGSPATSVTTVIGSVTGSSSTSIYAGSGGLYLSGSATTTTPGTIITGSRPASISDAYIGPLEVGVWPSNVGYGMIMHKDLAYTNEYALLQQNNGNTYLNCGAAASTLLRYNGTTRIQLNSTGIGFFGATPVAKQTVASDTLANLYTALRNYGLIT